MLAFHPMIKMSENFKTFLKLNLPSLADRYVILVDKKVVAKGKDIVSLLDSVHKKYPNKIPLVAKIPDKSALVL